MDVDRVTGCRFSPASATARPTLATAVLAGIGAGVAGGLAMNLFARVVAAATGGHEASGAAPGSDRNGRGVQPPQAEGRADDDAPVRVGRIAYRMATSSEPRHPLALRLGTAAHYAFSAALGVTYVLAARHVQAVRAAQGAAYGAAVWLIADETVMPGLRLSRGPRRLSPGLLAYGLGGHVLYGFTLELAGNRLLATARRPPRW